MNLYDGLSDPRCRDTVRVGTKGGTGFLYIGSKDELLTSGSPYLDRKVTDSFRSRIDNHTVIIIDGKENGALDYSGPPATFRGMNKDLAADLVEAMYKQALLDLRIYYRDIIAAGSLTVLMKAARHAVDAERFLLEDPYGFFDNGAKRFIYEVRKIAIESYGRPRIRINAGNTVPDFLYLCNGKKCGDCLEGCRHTRDRDFAVDPDAGWFVQELENDDKGLSESVPGCGGEDPAVPGAAAADSGEY